MILSEDALIICSNCFSDKGLKLDTERIGIDPASPCANCGKIGYKKLSISGLEMLTHRFFVWGSIMRVNYGAAPLIQFNTHKKTSITFQPWLEPDVKLIEDKLGVGFFYYGPRLWMLGEIEPLKALKKPNTRQSIIERVLVEFPTKHLLPSESFYRIRVNPIQPQEINQYDSPPIELAGRGRLDVKGRSVLYGSQDLEVCIHECRVAAEDEVFVASLSPKRDLHLLDLSILLKEERQITEFESLDLTVNMLFLAGSHAYTITRAISEAARKAGFDGLVYPSYFSLLRLGLMPFQTTYGISHRRIEQFHEREQASVIPNLALFGHPVSSGIMSVNCINRLVINRVGYEYHFGPSGI